MKKLYILRTQNADSRTATGKISKESLLENTKLHISDVRNAMKYIADMMIEQAEIHDHTKIDYVDEFYDNFSKYKGVEFKEAGWFEKHVIEERHHLNDCVPKNVNLIDVFERICDICVAGMARSGSVYSDSLLYDILEKAYVDTIELVKNNICVVDDICPRITNYMHKGIICNEINDSRYFQTDSQVECFLQYFFDDKNDFGNKVLNHEEWLEMIHSLDRYKRFTREELENAGKECAGLMAGGIY